MDEKTAGLTAEELFELETFIKIMRNVYGFDVEYVKGLLWLPGLEKLVSAVLKSMKEANETVIENTLGVPVKLPKVESLAELKLKLELDGIDWNQKILSECPEEREKYPSIFP